MRLFDEAARAGDPYRLCFMDELFDARSTMNGSEAVTLIRQAEHRRQSEHAAAGSGDGATALPPAVIIRCSGLTGESDAARLRSGADDVWSKPMPSFTDGTLQATLARLLAQATVT